MGQTLFITSKNVKLYFYSAHTLLAAASSNSIATKH